MIKWTIEEEAELLKLLNDGFLYNDISIKLNRSNKSIKEKTNKLGYNQGMFKTISEIKCLECGKNIIISNRNKKEKLRKFCSKSCSVTYNNKIRTIDVRQKISKTLKNNKKDKKEVKENFCLYCGTSINKNIKYCSNKCQCDYNYIQYIKKWKTGEEDGKRGEYQISHYIERYIHEKYNNKCVKCGWSTKNPFTNNIPLEIDHIDGDAENNKEENLILLCPNCHALTETYKGANKGNGRHNRMKRYYDGKSY